MGSWGCCGAGCSHPSGPVPSAQALASREQLHAQYARSLQDKDQLRTRTRELAERADQLQLQLFQCEARLLAARGRLGQRQDGLVLVRGWVDVCPGPSHAHPTWGALAAFAPC